MKIVRIIARLNVGGPARHVVWLTEALNDEEFQTTLVAGTVPAGEKDMAYFASELGVAPFYIDEMSRELSPPQDAIAFWKIFRLLRRERPDIVHTHTAKAGTVGRLAGFCYRWMTPGTLVGRPRPVRFVHTYHGHVFHSYYGRLKTALFLSIERTLARLCSDRIVVISERQFAEINGRFGVGSADRFVIIPLGLDLDQFTRSERDRSAFRREIAAADGEVVIGIVGRLAEIKNIGLFLESARIALQSGGLPQLRFVVVGDGEQRAFLEQLAASLGISGRVTFIGSRRDIAVVYAGLDIVALTSLNEGTPLSLIEAMAAERPVISTSVGGVPDLIGEIGHEGDGFAVCRRGVIVDSFDPGDFARGMLALSADSDLRLRLGRAGREFAAASYSRERLVSDVKNLYRGLRAGA